MVPVLVVPFYITQFNCTIDVLKLGFGVLKLIIDVLKLGFGVLKLVFGVLKSGIDLEI